MEEKPEFYFGPISSKLPCMLHGADYNPEQWLDTPEILDEDLRLMKLAHCNVMAVGIFSWAAYEPQEGVFQFEWMDRILDRLAENGINAILATPSGSKPGWMSHKYPEIRRVLPDGRREPHKGRHNHCPTSPVYREKVRIVNTKLAERYMDHPSLLLWHVSNEYGGECHCELCYAAFRNWLKSRYGTLEELNRAWWTRFWSHTFTEWQHIEPADSSIHGLILDWKRFVTDQTVDFFRHEIEPLKRITPAVPVTTNMMGAYPGLDYWKFMPYLDVVSFDCYPNWHGTWEDWKVGAHISFLYDLNRSFKRGKPFLLMESTPSSTNWMDVCRLKRPGMHTLSSIQAVAHGADSVQYFQWRKSRGGTEKFHGAVVDHVGHENTRIFSDVTELGKILGKLDSVVGASVQPEVAIIFDWENRWAFNGAEGPLNSEKNIDHRIFRHYIPFWQRGITVDVINMDCDFSKYKLVIAPLLYMVRNGVAERLEKMVGDGACFVTTYQSGIVDNSDLCFLTGRPGPLRKLLGVWAEETDALYPHQKRNVIATPTNGCNLNGAYVAGDYIDVLHCEGATPLATFGEDFFKDHPALTVNRFGRGDAYYIASENDDRFLDDFYEGIVAKLHLCRTLESELSAGVTVKLRTNGKRRFVFILNFKDIMQSVELGEGVWMDLVSGNRKKGKQILEGYGFLILEKINPV